MQIHPVTRSNVCTKQHFIMFYSGETNRRKNDQQLLASQSVLLIICQLWGVVILRLEHQTVGREDWCQSTYRSFRLQQFFFIPLCLCLTGQKLTAVGPFCLVSVPGEVSDPPHREMQKTCHGLTTPRERKLKINHSFVSPRQGFFELNVRF